MVWEIEMGEEERRGEENCYRIVNYIVNQGVILFTGGKSCCGVAPILLHALHILFWLMRTVPSSVIGLLSVF